VASGRLTWPTSHEDLTVEECLALLSSKELGRVAFTYDAVRQEGPVILPVNYVMDGDSVIVRTSPYGCIGRSLLRRESAFAVDDIDERTGVGWTVLIRGSAISLPRHEVHHLQRRPLAWREGVHALFLRIAPRVITGRRYGRFTRADARPTPEDTHHSSGLDQPGADGVAGQLGAVAHAELGEDVLPVPLDRLG
jgi:uncharacterized protein